MAQRIPPLSLWSFSRRKAAGFLLLVVWREAETEETEETANLYYHWILMTPCVLYLHSAYLFILIIRAAANHRFIFMHSLHLYNIVSIVTASSQGLMLCIYIYIYIASVRVVSWRASFSTSVCFYCCSSVYSNTIFLLSWRLLFFSSLRAEPFPPDGERWAEH